MQSSDSNVYTVPFLYCICVCIGPDYPDYLAVCCGGFLMGSVCEETFQNVISTIPSTADSASCQQHCQVGITSCQEHCQQGITSCQQHCQVRITSCQQYCQIGITSCQQHCQVGMTSCQQNFQVEITSC